LASGYWFLENNTKIIMRSLYSLAYFWVGADETHCETGAGQFVGELLHVWNGEMHLCAVISGAATKII
jgi:hypothetical protein